MDRDTLFSLALGRLLREKTLNSKNSRFINFWSAPEFEANFRCLCMYTVLAICLEVIDKHLIIK